MNTRKLYLFFNRDNIVPLIFGTSIFFLNLPYFVWSVSNLQNILFIPLIFFSIFYLKPITQNNLFVILIFLYLFFYMSIGLNFFGYLFQLFFIIFLLINDDLLIKSFRIFKYIFTAITSISLIIYILILFSPIPIPFEKINPFNTLKSLPYYQYPFLISEGPLSIQNFNIRFFGVFDEPGVVGTIVTILLFSENYNLRSKMNIVLFVAGVFAFSLYFFVSSIVYYLVFTKNKYRVLFITLFTIFFLLTRNNDIISPLIWDRFTIEDNQWKGDNRSDAQVDQVFSQLNTNNNNEIYWGKGGWYTSVHGLMGASTYKQIVINYGFVFLFIFILIFVYIAHYNIQSKKYLLLYLFMFLGIMYQRPGMIYSPGAFYLLVAPIYAIKLNYAERTQVCKKSRLD